MQRVGYQDPETTPLFVASTTAKSAARNAVHLARLLRSHPYPVDFGDA